MSGKKKNEKFDFQLEKNKKKTQIQNEHKKIEQTQKHGE